MSNRYIILIKKALLKFRIIKLRWKYGHIIPNDLKVDKKTSLVIHKGCSLKIGNNVYLRSNPKGYHCGMPFPTTLLADGDNAFIQIGDNCRINGVYIHSKKGISIGNNCVIASGVTIIDSNGHEVHSSNRTIGKDYPETIYIGDNVWIGMNAIVLKGTTIESNCIVSAGSVVKGKFPANCIIQGNPAIISGKI